MPTIGGASIEINRYHANDALRASAHPTAISASYRVNNVNNNNGNGCHIFNSHSELAFENQKLQLQLELKNKELAMKDRENDNLKEIIALLKRESPQPI